MKVYGWRHKSNASFIILTSDSESTNLVLEAWLRSIGIKWENRFKHFEEIEAELTYEDKGF